MQRYALKLAFNGAAYKGWQIQPNGVTVQETLNNALSVLLKEEIKTTGCGRTDTGVHASCFFVHFDANTPLNSKHLKSLNAILPEDIAIHSIYKTSPDFNSRFDAISRTYEYRISLQKNPFLNGLTLRRFQKVEMKPMNDVLEKLIGFRNFEAFSKVHTEVNNFDCDLMYAQWEQKENLLIFKIKANRFLRNMVRALTGTILQVGEGIISVEEFFQILESRDRSKAGTSMPAHALFLTEIEYPPGTFEEIASE